MYSAIFSRFYRQSNSILITDEPYPFPTKCYDRIARLTKDMAQMERLFINPKINMRQYTLDAVDNKHVIIEKTKEGALP